MQAFSSYIVDKALILIPVLIILGKFLKISMVKDKFIPVVLLVLGIAGSLAVLGLNAQAVIQGVLVAGASVFANQLVKQVKKES